MDGTVVGQITDEVTQRGIWRQWKKVMSQGVEVPTRRRGSGNGAARRRQLQDRVSENPAHQ
jgi:hypothetical protein